MGSLFGDDGDDTLIDGDDDIILDAAGGDIYLKDSGNVYGRLTNSGGNLRIKNVNTNVITFSNDDTKVEGDLTTVGTCKAAGFIDSSVEIFPGDTTGQAIATTGNTLLLLGGNGSNDTYTLAAGTTIGQMKRIACVCDENTGCGTDSAVVTVTDASWGGSGTITFSGISFIDLIWVTIAAGDRWMPAVTTAALG